MYKIVILILLFFPTLIFAADEQVIKIQPGPDSGKDTYFGIGSVGGQLGRPDSLGIRVGGWGDTWITYIQFDLSSIPMDAVISSAMLGLYNFSTTNQNEGKIFLVSEPWDESYPTVNGSPAFIDLDLPYFPIANVPAWSTADVTSMVQDWHAGVVPNYGWRIQGKYNTSNRAKEFYSSDYLDNPLLRPYLEITYTVPEEEVTVAGGVEKLQAYIDSLVSKTLRNSYTAHVKNILGFF